MSQPMTGPMTGLGVFLRAFARRDRLMVGSYALGITLLYWSQAVSVDGLYATRAAFEEAAALMGSNPAFVAMAGPARALDTTGGQVAWQASAFGAVVIGLMSMFLVGRHTRAEEESGRDELLRAGAVARHTPTTATLVVTTAANVLVGVAVTASLVGYGLAVPGAVALGLGLTGCGLAFGGVTLLAVQLTSSTRAAYGLTGAVIGASYGLRAVGDVSGGGLSWLSPIGWYQGMHAYSGERWWPLLLLAAFIGAVLSGAYAAFARRDFGAGLWPSRPGPAAAGPRLRSSLGLNWRLQRGSVIGWSVGLLLTGLSYGAIGDNVGSLMGDSSLTKDLFGAGDVTDSFYATAALMIGLLASAFTVSSVLRPRSEEESGRLEMLLSTALPRQRWWLGNVLITGGGTLLVLMAAGAGMGVGFALTTGDWSRSPGLLLATLVTLPAALALGGLARLLVGVAPHRAVLAWLGLGYCTVALFFGALLQLPEWFLDLSPFNHLGRYPAEPITWVPAGMVLLVGLLCSATGLATFRRRDVLSR